MTTILNLFPRDEAVFERPQPLVTPTVLAAARASLEAQPQTLQTTLALEILRQAIVGGPIEAEALVQGLLELAASLLPALPLPQVVPHADLMRPLADLRLIERELFESCLEQGLAVHGYEVQVGALPAAVEVYSDDVELMLDPPANRVFVQPDALACSRREACLLALLRQQGVPMPWPRIDETARLPLHRVPTGELDNVMLVSELTVAGVSVPWWFDEEDLLVLRGTAPEARATLRASGAQIAAAWMYATVEDWGVQRLYNALGPVHSSEALLDQWVDRLFRKFFPEESRVRIKWQVDHEHVGHLRKIVSETLMLSAVLQKRAGVDVEVLRGVIKDLERDLEVRAASLPQL